MKAFPQCQTCTNTTCRNHDTDIKSTEKCPAKIPYKYHKGKQGNRKRKHVTRNIGIYEDDFALIVSHKLEFRETYADAFHELIELAVMGGYPRRVGFPKEPKYFQSDAG